MIHRYVKPQVMAEWLATNYPDNPEYITPHPFKGWMLFMQDNGGVGFTQYEIEDSYLKALGYTEGTFHDRWKNYMDDLGIGVGKTSLRDRLNEFFTTVIETEPFYMEDTFAGANNTPVHGRTTDVGSLTWAGYASNEPLLDGLGSVKMTANGLTRGTVVMPEGNYDVTVNALGGAGGSASSRYIGAIARYIDASNHLYAWYQGSSGNIWLYKVDGGVTTSLDSTATGVLSQGNLDVRILAVDNNVKVYLGGVLQIDHTLTGGDATKFNNTVGGVGFRINGFSSTLVNSISAQTV